MTFERLIYPFSLAFWRSPPVVALEPMTIEGLTLAPVVAAAVVRLIDQLELQLADLEETAAKSEVTAVAAGVAGTKVDVHGFARRKPARRLLPDHLPRQRVVYPGPSACPCCGGVLRKLG